MLQVTGQAATQLEQARQQQGLPETAGVRLSGTPTADGQISIQIGFVEGPDEGDQVAEKEGARVFVAEELTEPLADAELHAEPTEEGMQLMLRPRGEGDEPEDGGGAASG